MLGFEHATAFTTCQRRIRVPRAQSGGGSGAYLQKGAGLRGLRGSDQASQGPVADAGFGVVRHAQPLALRPLAARRWRSIGVHAMVDGHAYPTLARGASDLWDRRSVSGAIQVVPDSRGRSFVDGAALCGTEPIAGKSGAGGGGLAVVESLASRAWRRLRTFRRGSAADALGLAAPGAEPSKRRRARGVATIGGARRAVWRDHLAGTNGQATRLGVHASRSGSSTESNVREGIPAVQRLPTPLNFLVDQVQQLCCPLFQAVWKKLGTKRALWDNLRSHFRHFIFQSMRHLYQVMLYDLAKNLPAPTSNNSC